MFSFGLTIKTEREDVSSKSRGRSRTAAGNLAAWFVKRLHPGPSSQTVTAACVLAPPQQQATCLTPHLLDDHGIPQ